MKSCNIIFLLCAGGMMCFAPEASSQQYQIRNDTILLEKLEMLKRPHGFGIGRVPGDDQWIVPGAGGGAPGGPGLAPGGTPGRPSGGASGGRVIWTCNSLVGNKRMKCLMERIGKKHRLEGIMLRDLGG